MARYQPYTRAALKVRYRLRTLLILLAVGPIVLAWGWWAYSKWRDERQIVIGFHINNWGRVRPPLFPPTPEEQAAINAWFDALPSSPSEK
jgi:hypothetical protein